MRLKRGFTLIEVMVTLLILMFGLLGIAGLMAKGQKASHEAYQRQQALSLANDMLERIHANPAQAVPYAAGAPAGAPLGTGGSLYGAVSSCVGATCTAAQLVNHDLAMWDGLLQGSGERSGSDLIGGIVAARGCIEETANTLASCPAAPDVFDSYTRTVRVSVAWQGQEDTRLTNAAQPSTCGEDQYGTPGRRRLVALDTMLRIPC